MFSQLVIFNVAKKSHRNKKLDKNQQRLSGKGENVGEVKICQRI